MEKLNGKISKNYSILLSEENGSIHDIPRMKFAECRSQRRNLIVSDCIRRRIKLLIATSHEDNLASLANPDIAALRFCARLNNVKDRNWLIPQMVGMEFASAQARMRNREMSKVFSPVRVREFFTILL